MGTTALVTQFLSLALIVNVSSLTNNTDALCEENLRIQVQNGTIVKGGGLLAEDGTIYPEDTFWKEQDTWWTCPCSLGTCIRICNINQSLEYLENKLQIENIQLYLKDEANFTTYIWDNAMANRTTLSSIFWLVHLGDEADQCPAGSRPELHLHPNLYRDGSLFYISYDGIFRHLYEPEQFCVFLIDLEDYLVTSICQQEQEYSAAQQRWIFIGLLAISILILILTLSALILCIWCGMKKLWEKLRPKCCKDSAVETKCDAS